MRFLGLGVLCTLLTFASGCIGVSLNFEIQNHAAAYVVDKKLGMTATFRLHNEEAPTIATLHTEYDTYSSMSVLKNNHSASTDVISLVVLTNASLIDDTATQALLGVPCPVKSKVFGGEHLMGEFVRGNWGHFKAGLPVEIEIDTGSEQFEKWLANCTGNYDSIFADYEKQIRSNTPKQYTMGPLEQVALDHDGAFTISIIGDQMLVNYPKITIVKEAKVEEKD